MKEDESWLQTGSADNIGPEAFTAIFDALDRKVSGKSADALKHVYQPL